MARFSSLPLPPPHPCSGSIYCTALTKNIHDHDVYTNPLQISCPAMGLEPLMLMLMLMLMLLLMLLLMPMAMVMVMVMVMPTDTRTNTNS